MKQAPVLCCLFSEIADTGWLSEMFRAFWHHLFDKILKTKPETT